MSVQRRRARLQPAAGKTYPDRAFKVTAEGIEAYARATNDPNECYLAGDASVAGPVWPVVPAFGFFMAAARDPDLGADLRRLLHLREEHILRRPVRVGDVLEVSGTLETVDEEAGTFTVGVSERDRDGNEVAFVRAVFLVRGAGRPAPVVPEVPHRTASYEDRVHIDDDQTLRYAEASGDRNVIHLDRQEARRSGLGGIIVHGMCTMAMAAAGAVNGLAGGDPTLIQRIQATFARPVFPGQDLVTRFWPKLEDANAQVFGFATFNEDGAAVLTNAETRVRI